MRIWNDELKYYVWKGAFPLMFEWISTLLILQGLNVHTH